MNIKTHNNPIYDFLIMCIDAVLVGGSYALSFWAIKYLGMVKVVRIDSWMLIACTLIALFIMYIYEFYTKFIRKKYELIISVFLVTIELTVIMVFLEIFTNSIEDPMIRGFIILFPVILLPTMVVWKLILAHFIKIIEGKPKLLVIESRDVETDLARKVKYAYVYLYEAWYTQIDVNDEEQIKDFMAEEFSQYESVFISPSIPEDLRDYFISQAVSAGKEIYILPNLYNISMMKNEMVQFEDTPALRIKPFGITKLQRFAKRSFDIFASICGIVLTSPIMLLVALMIKLESKGPAIYKQMRVTRKQKEFNIYKFRTMVADAEKKTGPTLAIEHDPRITKVGRILRMTRLDELPQLFNIFRGSMSVVGPRPERPVFVKQFIKEIDNYDKRFFVKAGLTGLAQVYSRYDTNVQDKTLYDLLYIKDYSFGLDIKMILLTIKTMFIKESSSGVKQPKVYQKNENNTAYKQAVSAEAPGSGKQQ